MPLLCSRIRRSTSSRVTLPPEPLPETSPRSISYSWASFLTEGEALTSFSTSLWPSSSAVSWGLLGLRPILLWGFLWSFLFFLLGFFGGSIAAGAIGFAFSDGPDDLSDANGLALALGYGLQDAVLLGLDLEVDLVGLELDEGLAGLHGLALLLEPASDRRVGYRLPELRDVYLNRQLATPPSLGSPPGASVALARGAALRPLRGRLGLLQVPFDALEGSPDYARVLLLVEARGALGRAGPGRLADVPNRELPSVSARRRGSTNVQAPMFFGSSWTQSISRRLG